MNLVWGMLDNIYVPLLVHDAVQLIPPKDFSTRLFILKLLAWNFSRSLGWPLENMLKKLSPSFFFFHPGRKLCSSQRLTRLQNLRECGQDTYFNCSHVLLLFNSCKHSLEPAFLVACCSAHQGFLQKLAGPRNSQTPWESLNAFLTEGLAISSPGAHFKVKHVNTHFLNPTEDF